MSPCRRSFPLALLGLLIAAAPVGAQNAGVGLADALAPVRFVGPAPNLSAIENKSAVVLAYASWCPKCNVWSADFFKQLKEAAVASPVIVVAVNADSNTRGVAYALERGLIGPNIFHADDPTIVERLRLESELFRMAIFDPAGKAIDTMGASYYTGDGPKKYVVPTRLLKGEFGGAFRALQPKMSEPVRAAYWPIELGQPMSSKWAAKAKAGLPRDFREEFETSLETYLDGRLAATELADGADAEAKLTAHGAAEELAKNFGGTPQGAKAKTFLSTLEKDVAMKKEIAAAVAYRKARATAKNEVALRKAMKSLAQRFDGTHYGELAERAAKGE